MTRNKQMMIKKAGCERGRKGHMVMHLLRVKGLGEE